MRIDVWSDLVCPWCAVGKAHLELALGQFEHADRVEVVWRSFELDPGAPEVREGSYAELLAARYGTSAEGGRAMVGRLSAAMERAGLDARFDRARSANTLDAHRLLHLAQVLEGEAFATEVRADEAEAARREITAVPTFLFDGRHVVPGAQSAESLLATLRRTYGATQQAKDGAGLEQPPVVREAGHAP